MFKLLKNILSGTANEGSQSLNKLAAYQDDIADYVKPEQGFLHATTVDDFLNPNKKIADLMDSTDAFNKYVLPGGKTNLEVYDAFRTDILESMKTDQFLTKEGMSASLENLDATGSLYASPYNVAGQTKGSELTDFLSGSSKTFGAVGLLGTAALAGGVNTVMGGDFSTGAMIGLGAAGISRGLSKVYMDSLGGMENVAMKNLMHKGGENVDDFSSMSRYAKLSTIKKMSLDETGLDETIQTEAKKFITQKGPNKIAKHNRAMTIGGGMLAGVAFTGRSDKRDYRRGFNSHRGNRV